MSTMRAPVVGRDTAAIPLQPASYDIWDKKYRLKAKQANRSTAASTTPISASRAHCPMWKPPQRSEALVRAFPVGTAPRCDSGWPHHVQCRRAGAQAGHLHDQLHRVRHHRRLDGRHPGEGARGRPHVEGRLRHRLRILHAASARRVRLGRGCLHLRPAVVHGYLRQDVLHRLVGRRPPRRADGHVRRQPSRCEGIHPRQARRRPPAPVQPVAADHRRFHGSRGARPGLAAGVPGARQGTGRDRPQRRRQSRLARVAHPRQLRRARRRPGGLQDLRPHPCAPPVGHDHGVHVRLCRAGFHPDRQASTR